MRMVALAVAVFTVICRASSTIRSNEGAAVAEATWIALAASTATTAMTAARTAMRMAGRLPGWHERLAQRGIVLDANERPDLSISQPGARRHRPNQTASTGSSRMEPLRSSRERSGAARHSRLPSKSSGSRRPAPRTVRRSRFAAAPSPLRKRLWCAGTGEIDPGFPRRPGMRSLR